MTNPRPEEFANGRVPVTRLPKPGETPADLARLAEEAAVREREIEAERAKERLHEERVAKEAQDRRAKGESSQREYERLRDEERERAVASAAWEALRTGLAALEEFTRARPQLALTAEEKRAVASLRGVCDRIAAAYRG